MPAPSLNALTRQTLRFIARTQADGRQAYIGDTEATLVLVTNDDGSISKVGNARPSDIMLAGIQSISGQIDKVTVESAIAPNVSAKWWLSRNRGVTKKRVKAVSVTARDGFYVVLLEES